MDPLVMSKAFKGRDLDKLKKDVQAHLFGRTTHIRIDVPESVGTKQHIHSLGGRFVADFLAFYLDGRTEAEFLAHARARYPDTYRVDWKHPVGLLRDDATAHL